MNIKIMHLVSNRWYSAITGYALSAMKAARILGFENILVGLAQKQAVKKSVENGFKTYELSSFSLFSRNQLASIINDENPEIVIVYGGPETFLSKVLSQGKAKKRLIYRFLGYDTANKSWLKKRTLSLSLSHCTGVIVPCKKLFEQLTLLKLKSPVQLIPMGIDGQEFFLNQQNIDKFEYSRPLVQIVGRLDPVKGHRDFFAIYRTMLNNWPSHLPKPLLQVIGEPANMSGEQLRREAKEFKLVEGEDIEYLLYRVEPINLMMVKASLGVIPSIGSELICRVGEEFLMSGVRILVSGVGGLKDLITPQFGACYEGKTRQQSAEILGEQLILGFSEGFDQKLARAHLAADLFSLDSMAQKMAEFFAR